MSYDNGKSGKTLKGSLITVPGSPSGEPIFSTRYAYNSCCMVEYSGEAKFGTSESALKWFLQKFEYGTGCELTAVLNACNQITTKATELSIDTVSDAPEVRVTIVGGLFDMVSVGDTVEVDTTANKWVGTISQKLSDTEILVTTTANATADETGTTVTDEGLLITLKTSKDFQQRRWDKREYYIYA